jgi:CysZ protein
MPSKAARDLRNRRWTEVFLAGLMVSAMVAVPILNLLTPLFATALMTRLYKRVA